MTKKTARPATKKTPRKRSSKHSTEKPSLHDLLNWGIMFATEQATEASLKADETFHVDRDLYTLWEQYRKIQLNAAVCLRTLRNTEMKRKAAAQTK